MTDQDAIVVTAPSAPNLASIGDAPCANRSCVTTRPAISLLYHNLHNVSSPPKTRNGATRIRIVPILLRLFSPKPTIIDDPRIFLPCGDATGLGHLGSDPERAVKSRKDAHNG